ncbi:MAG: CxxC-x17-CxxC domain-containing protein [Candidatus Omnitrophota bacterium]
MKKRSKDKGLSEPPRIDPDMAGLINRVLQQLVVLDRKIDTLISRSSQGQGETKPFPKPFQQPGQTYGHGERRQDNNYRERVMHKAICADCKKECEVPFRPSGERPVYCKECFSKRKAGGPFKGRPDVRPSGPAVPQAAHFDKPHGAAKRRPAEKKRPAARRRKAR